MTIEIRAQLDAALAELDFFDPKAGFVPSRLGEVLNKETPIRVGQDARLWRYVSGVWKPDGREWVGARTRDLLGERFRKRHLEEVRSWLLADMPKIGIDPNPDWLNLPNGRLNWRTGELAEHSPEDYDTIRIPVAWTPNATCSRFDNFLTQVLPADAIEFVLEWMGYLLVPDTRFQRAAMLLGPGGTGKSTLLHVLRQLCGPANAATVSLHDLSDNRFSKADLFGKLVNVLGDLDARAVERSDTFKRIVGEDPLRGEFKFGQPFDFQPFVRLIFSANEAPPTSDQSTAYFDRWLIVPMTCRFRNSEQEDPNLRHRLTRSGELEGILQLVVPALRRLMERGRFEIPSSVVKAGDAFRSQLDTIRAFVEERCELGPGNFERRKAVYDAYESWCWDNGRKALGSMTFYARLRSDYPISDHKIGLSGFKGICLADQ